MASKELKELRQAAAKFLQLADLFSEQVSNYINGSDDEADFKAYRKVIVANCEFNHLYAGYCDEPYKAPELDYELAEATIHGM